MNPTPTLLRRTCSSIAGTISAFALLTAPALAVPTAVPYLGYLVYDGGGPVHGVIGVEVQIFSAESGGTSLWGPHAFTSVAVTDGVFHLVLGGASSPALDPALDSESPLWLDFTIDGQPMAPRQAMLSVPFARRAAVASLATQATSAQQLGGVSAAHYAKFSDLPAAAVSGSFADLVDVPPALAEATGTPGALPRFTEAHTLADSILSQTAGGALTVSGAAEVSGRLQALSVKVGADESACDAESAGTLRWHAGSLEACDGAAWQAVGTGGSSGSGGGVLDLPATCKAILDAGDSTGDGAYWISPDGYRPVQVYCDMSTDGGGWTLAGFSRAGGAGHMNMYSLKCGGGAYHPTSRQGSGAIAAVELARASTSVAFAQSTSTTIVTGNMLQYDVVSRFEIPNPSLITFDAHSMHTGYAAQGCVPVTVSYLKGGSGTLTRYTLDRSLGATWADSFPTGYGAVPTSNCSSTYSAGPYTQSIHSGAGTNSSTGGPPMFTCDLGDARIRYNFQGIYLPTSVSASGTTSIWFR